MHPVLTLVRRHRRQPRRCATSRGATRGSSTAIACSLLLMVACTATSQATGRQVDAATDDSVAPPITQARPPVEAAQERPPPRRIDELSLQQRPPWMDKYAVADSEPLVFLAVDRVMVKFSLPRSAAIELQNQLRDRVRQGGTGVEAAFEEALAKVTSGQFEAYQPARIAAAKFVVAIDLDETMIDQYLRNPVSEDASRCESVTLTPGDQPARSVLRPGLAQFVRGIAARGGVIVLFSANADDNVLAHASAIRIDGMSLREHPAVAGILSNSHLILQDRDVLDAQGVVQRGRPVIEPSKDLRFIDETLQKVIIVDDNPHRVFQLRNLRVIDKLDGDRLCQSTEKAARQARASGTLVGGDEGAMAMTRSFATILGEIDESLDYMKANDVPFARAYLPYTALGTVTVESLMQGGKATEKRARNLVRANPEWVPEDF